MKRPLLLLSGLLMCAALMAQTTILDFESPATSTTYQYFGSGLEGQLNNIIANPDPSGANTSATVADHVKPAGSETFAGAFANPVPATAFDFSGQSEVCIKVWSMNPGTVSLKFENSSNGAQNWLGTGTIPTGQTWTNVCLDVATPSLEPPFEPVVGGQYPAAVIFFDFGTSPAEDRTYYFDDLVVNPGIAGLVADVTFSVDMNYYAGAFTTVAVSGSFNGWSGDSNPLSDADGDGIWEGTVAGIPGGSHEYKFTLDNFAGQEQFVGTETCTVTDPSGQFTNRVLFVDEPTMELGTNCFNSCYACGESLQITFNVSATQVSTSGDGIFIAGGGNFGIPGDYLMNDDDGDDIWTLTFEREVGFQSFYAFYNGLCPDFSCKENLSGQPCADPNNFNDRFLPAVTQDTVVTTCYGQCTTDTQCTTLPQNGNITFQVDMNNYTEPFTTVYVAGGFNGWSDVANPLTDANGDGIWETTIVVPGGNQEYKFQVDAWAAQEMLIVGTPCTVTDPSGQFTNRLITVDGDETVCFIWSTCNACGVVPPDNRAVTFAVDMNNYTDPFTTVFVSGGFNGWGGGNNPLADADGDGIWEATIDLPDGTYEYKFQVDEWVVQELFAPGGSCTITSPDGQFTNRFIEVASDTAVCFTWNSCEACGAEPPATYEVTFAVDMNNYADPFTTVFVSGGFNGWGGGNNPLADADGDGIWEATIQIPEGPHEYKFQVDEWVVQEEFAPGGSCTITSPDGQFTNRFIEVASDTSVCFEWNTCLGCGAEPPMTFDITFQVDMSDYTDPFTTAFVSGSFNGWGGGNNPLSDSDGDGIWETTIALAASNYEYKFQLDEWAVDEQFEPGGPCTVTDPSGQFVNRLIEVTEEATVCFKWATCIECDDVANRNLTIDPTLFEVNPTVVSDFALVTFNEQILAEKNLRVFNATGMLVQQYQVEAGATQQRLETAALAPGIYLVYVQVGNTIATKKIVKQ